MRFIQAFGIGGCVAALSMLASAQQPTTALELRAELPSQSLPTEATQTLVAVMTNRGTQPIEILVPLHRPLVPFPNWELTSNDGTIVHPQAASFQSMWKHGLQGEILVLGPGTEMRFESRVQLAPGTWTARCRFEQASDEVLWSEKAFEVTKRHRPSLWIGKTESKPVSLQVGERQVAALKLELPPRALPGAPHILKLHYLPGASTPAEAFPAAFELSVGSKAYGSGTVRLVWRDGQLVPAAANEFQPFDFSALEDDHALSIDLARLSFMRDPGRKALGLGDLVPDGTFHITMSVLAADGETWVSGTGAGHIAPLAEIKKLGLKLLVKATDRERIFDVILRNEGQASERVPAVMSYPSHLCFALRAVGEKPSPAHVSISYAAEHNHRLMDLTGLHPAAVIPAPLSWRSDGFELRSSYESDGTALLAPGAELRRRIDLNALVTGSDEGLPAAMQLVAIWQNREPGWRFGLQEPLLTGFIESAPLRLPALRK